MSIATAPDTARILSELDASRPFLVCFVCTGNTCRSPMAAAALNHLFRVPPVCTACDMTKVLSAKQIVYNDILCGLADYEMRNESLPSLYEKLRKEFDALSEKGGAFKELFRYVAAVCKICCKKTDICIKLSRGYGNDNALLQRIKDELLPELLEDYSALKKIHYRLWHQSYRPFGFEIVDGRYGWAMERIRTAVLRISEYLNGEVDSLPELCIEKVPFASKSSFTTHTSIASAYRPKGW